MPGNTKKVYYSEYLQLEKLLSAQSRESAKGAEGAHDEWLFIIIHQVYELWFKQILLELDEVLDKFGNSHLEESFLPKAFARLQRVNRIFETFSTHFAVLETMTPMDFLEFRNYLVPATGFQSVQFRKIEAKLGLKREWRQYLDREIFFKNLKKEDQDEILQEEAKPGLLQLVDTWLGRMPFLEFSPFNFWDQYKKSVEELFESDKKIIDSLDFIDADKKDMDYKSLLNMKETIMAFLDPESFAKIKEEKGIRLSHKSCLAALFINLYRDEPLLQGPFQFLNALMDLDENIGSWRYRHTVLAQRMLGVKIGTGGSSGHEYLKSTIDNNRVFTDLFNLASFYIPRSSLPKLPEALKKELGFSFSGS